MAKYLDLQPGHPLLFKITNREDSYDAQETTLRPHSSFTGLPDPVRRAGTGVRVVHRHRSLWQTTDPTQLGRLSRDNVPPDWSFQKDFPGVINPTVSYHYETVSVFVPSWFPLSSDQHRQQQHRHIRLGVRHFLQSKSDCRKPGSGRQLPGRSGCAAETSSVTPCFFQVVDQTAANSPSGATLILVLNETTNTGAGSIHRSVCWWKASPTPVLMR